MVIQDFTYTYSETFRVRLLDDGKVVLNDENGLTALVFQYHGSTAEPLTGHDVDEAIVNAMLSSSLHSTSPEVSEAIAAIDDDESHRADAADTALGWPALAVRSWPT